MQSNRTIIDNGVGNASEDLEKLFQPFVQVDSKLTRQFEGTGLGLTLVQKLTDAHDGSVQVESEVGKGSRFTINLAARMEQTALPSTVQVTEDTYRLVAPFFDFEALGEVEVKGKAAPIKTYRPLGVKKSQGNLRGLEGLTSPLVGREAPLSLLNEQIEQLKIGAGAFVSVIEVMPIGNVQD